VIIPTKLLLYNMPQTQIGW